MYPNSTQAFYDCLHQIFYQGQSVTVRGLEIKELLSYRVDIEKPNERVLVIPHRANNIFATIAETLWMIAGRNDLEFLLPYLPRAGDFSDDGKSWRAGYGKRLRHWQNHIDQIEQVVLLLSRDLNSRRAVMTIFDPTEDFTDSRDIPCNNWLHCIVRDSQLHMNIAVRSNDIIWGFSGINVFEWSVLQEMLAYWLGVEIGSVHYLIGSLHLYARHFHRAQAILDHEAEKTIYDLGVKPFRFQTPYAEFTGVLSSWFEIENRMRSSPLNIDQEIQAISDDFLKYSLYMLYIYNQFLQKAAPEVLFQLVAQMPVSDFRIAALEFLLRKYPNQNLDWLTDQEQHFLQTFRKP